MERKFDRIWIGFAFLCFLAYWAYLVYPDSDVINAFLSVSIVLFSVTFWFWFLDSAIEVGRGLTSLFTDYVRNMKAANDPDIALAHEIRLMDDEAKAIYKMLVLVNLDENANEPLPGFKFLTSAYAVRWFISALNMYPDLPAIRGARGDWMPREQAHELTSWLVKNKFAEWGSGARPAHWVSIEAKLEAAEKFRVK
jgi:hypothetical protein